MASLCDILRAPPHYFHARYLPPPTSQLMRMLVRCIAPGFLIGFLKHCSPEWFRANGFDAKGWGTLSSLNFMFNAYKGENAEKHF